MEPERLAVAAEIHFVHLIAQLLAKGFYTAPGYAEEGEIFEEADISHMHMKKKLSKSG
jgi:predicted GNAT family N-acyltransferase